MGFPNISTIGSWTPGQGIDRDPEYFNDFQTAFYCPNLGLPGESNPAAEFSEVADRGVWLVTRDAAPTIVVEDAAAGGILRITTGSSAADFCSCQMNGQPWVVASNKDIYFCCRMAVDDADDTRWFIGLAAADVSGSTLGPILDGVSESLGFRQTVATGVDIFALTEDGNNETTTDTGIDMANDTFVELAFWVQSNSRVLYYVNGNLKATHATNIPNGDDLTLTMEVQSPTASSQLRVDYLFCAQAR
jgi:hypothetical protein